MGKKGRVMDEIVMLAIWFSSVIAGMLVTMIMPYIFRESTGKGGVQDQLVRMPSEEALQG
jgi:hypothetical protein